MADERVHPTSAREWRAWLAEHHRTSRGVWFVAWKSHTGKPVIPYGDAVTEALAFGWVDSKKVTLDGDRTMMWYQAKKPETRAKRVRETAEKAAKGERANQWTRPADKR